MTTVVFLSMHPDVTSATRALEAGASGYVLKLEASDELIAAIRDALAGQIFLSPTLRTPALEERLLAGPGQTRELTLTPRQREVLQLLAAGKSAKAIGTILNISPRTAETHKYRMMDDLGLATTAELVQYAIRHGLVSVDPLSRRWRTRLHVEPSAFTIRTRDLGPCRADCLPPPPLSRSSPVRRTPPPGSESSRSFQSRRRSPWGRRRLVEMEHPPRRL